MHEVSVAASLLALAEEEIAAKGCARILGLTVQYGQISGIMPEALRLAFAAVSAGTPHEGASLVLEELPLRLRCPFCQTCFGADEGIFAPCPNCGEEFGHIVEQGRELMLMRIEAV